MQDFFKKAFTMRASSIGDALMGKYFLENLHSAHPSANLYMIAGSRGGMIRDLLAGYPWLKVLEANRHSPTSLMRVWKELVGTDLALTQPAENPFSLPSKFFARLVSKKLVGFEDGSRWNFLYDILVQFDGEEKSDGMILEEQKALRAAGVPIGFRDLTLSYLADPGVLARCHLAKKEYVLVHLFSGNDGRSISQKKRIEIVRALREALPEIHLVLTGGPEDAARAGEAAAGLPNVVNLAGRTSIQELINLIARARSTLALDTGAAHIAAHLRAPLCVLTRKAARHAWWGEPMYQNRPTVLCNEAADDSAPRFERCPPSLETIDLSTIVDKVAKLCVP